MDFKKPLNLGILIGAIVLTLVVTGLIIYGVTTHTETVMMTTCVVGDDVRYVSVEDTPPIEGESANESCERSEESRWTKQSFPIAITALLHDGAQIPDGHEAWRSIDQAIEDVNSQFGFRVFRKASSPSTATVFWGVPYSNTQYGQAEGYVHHFYNRDNAPDQVTGTPQCDPNGLCVHIGIRAVQSDRVAYIVLIHELGHALFLGHDDYTASVMYHRSFDDTTDDTMSNWTRFPDADVAGVRASAGL